MKATDVCITYMITRAKLKSENGSCMPNCLHFSIPSLAILFFICQLVLLFGINYVSLVSFYNINLISPHWKEKYRLPVLPLKKLPQRTLSLLSSKLILQCTCRHFFQERQAFSCLRAKQTAHLSFQLMVAIN